MTDEGAKFKLCPVCGMSNPSLLLECAGCKADLTGVRPPNREETGELSRISDCGASNPPGAGSARVFSLRTLDGSYRFTMTGPSCILGRNADAGEYLAGKPYVSRQHARIIIAGGEAFIENLSDTNPTFVNDAVISRAVPTPLASGDEVGLGGKSLNGKRQDEAAYFVFEVTE